MLCKSGKPSIIIIVIIFLLSRVYYLRVIRIEDRASGEGGVGVHTTYKRGPGFGGGWCRGTYYIQKRTWVRGRVVSGDCSNYRLAFLVESEHGKRCASLRARQGKARTPLTERPPSTPLQPPIMLQPPIPLQPP